MLLTRLVIIILLFVNTLYDHPKDKLIFISPVKIPLLLSANFGELRANHFHSGIDIKTQGVTGKEIVATADGYIYRISISPGGFGKALYVRHPSGYSTVYGHLDKFSADIEEYVKARQYEKESFRITIFPPKEKFTLTQGELIAYSGNSGSSGGPHLHYEIRKSESEKPINPLLFEFYKKDDINPVIEKLVIYPINHKKIISNNNKSRKINVKGGNGNYIISSDKVIKISGPTGFGIKAFDRLNGSHNKCAVYSIELRIDSNTIFKYQMNDFSFTESRFVNSHIDYETYQKEHMYIHRAFVLPNDKLKAYKELINRGIFNFNDSLLHKTEITVTDVHNNKSLLTFFVKSEITQASENEKEADENINIMAYDRRNKFTSEDIFVSIPAGALYDTLIFTYNKSDGGSNMLSDIHHIHDIYTPVHKAYTLSIKPKIIPAGKESKMLIIQKSDNNNLTPTSSKWSNGYLTSEVRSFGNFYVGIDTIAPKINANGLKSGAKLTGSRLIKIKITDDLSGIKNYQPYIDGKWALFEFDQKNNLLIYRFDEQRIEKNSEHDLSLKVIDNKDNTSSFNCRFTW
jgi:Peptidase family M23